MNELQIWKPICYNKQIWETANTAAFDRIAPSWMEYRKKLNEQEGEYAKFLQKLKYEHSVETGIIERLYDVDEVGVTVTLLKDGINSNFLQHENVENSEKVYGIIRDQYEAIDGIFRFIKNEREISTSFIKELHSVVTRSQDTTDAVTTTGELIKVPLLRGEYKKQENNPSRPDDGTVYKYCPPVQVSAQMDRLIEIHNQLADRKVHVIIRAAYFHHALTTIHPFQDGNGRITRLLTSLILIRDGYFPFSVKRAEREKYLKTLSQADENNVQPLLDFVSSTQIRAIDSALGFASIDNENLDSIIQALQNRLAEKEAQRIRAFDANRDEINTIILNCLKNMKVLLSQKLGYDIQLNSGGNVEQSHLSITHQMGIYATKFNYFMKRSMPYKWFKLSFSINERRFMIILFTHHFGQTDDAIAIGGVLETSIKEGARASTYTRKSKFGDFNIIPLEVPPFTLSLLPEINTSTKSDIQQHVERLALVGMAGIVAEV
ncbi:MAG: Fic family protein [Clostridiales bacterium]|jgi:Fic family protein|nr:Fic family protein [Clostridiales bacterium]